MANIAGNGWKSRSLDELGFVGRGKSKHRPRDAAHLYGGPYPFIQTGDVKHSNLYVNKYNQTYSEAGLAQSRLWKSGTLCITIAANIADTAILGIDACFPDSVIGFVPDEKKADVRFVKYLFNTLQSHYQQYSQGAAQDNLSQQKLLSLKFLVPKLSIQKKIAQILSTYDDLIENNLRRIALLEQSARLLYEEWFVRLRFPGYENTQVIDGIPHVWERTTAFEVMEVNSGGTPKTAIPEFWDGEIPFYTPKDSQQHAYALKTQKNLTESGLSKCNSKLYPKNTIFITARGTVGNLNLAQSSMAMNQSCYALKGRGEVSQLFLFCAIRNSIEQFRQRAVGAVFDAIIVDTFKLIPFVLPDGNTIRSFEQIVAPLFRQVENLLVQNQKLKQARDLLLPKLMNGEIAV